MCTEIAGKLDPAGILGVSSDSKRYEERQEEIFNEEGTYTDTRSCTTGGCPPDVVVEFRPSQSKYGEFGFDWVRVEDADLSLDASDVDYTKNIGTHFSSQTKDVSGNIISTTFCSSASIPDNCVKANPNNFKIDEIKRDALRDSFTKLNLVSSIRTIPSLKSTFDYRIPVLTLMPKDATLNPDNLNIEALLDVNVYIGKIKPTEMKLEVVKVDSYGNPTNEIVSNIASMIKISKLNIPNKSTMEHIKITSVTALPFDVMVMVKVNQTYRLGAFKILKNSVVKHLNFTMIAVLTNISDLEKPLESQRSIRLIPGPLKTPNLGGADIAGMRKLLAQSLIYVNEIRLPSNVKTLDMNDKFLQQHLLFKRREPKAGDPTIPNPDVAARSTVPIVYDTASLAFMEHLNIDESSQIIKDEMKIQIRQKYRTNASEGENIIQALENAFVFYFLDTVAYSPTYITHAAGGAVIGAKSAEYYGNKNTDAATLAHEIGHCLGLQHTFTPYKEDAMVTKSRFYSDRIYRTESLMEDGNYLYEYNNDGFSTNRFSDSYTYKYKSTDNIMDYSRKTNIFYHWQSKIIFSDNRLIPKYRSIP